MISVRLPVWCPTDTYYEKYQMVVVKGEGESK